MANEAAKTIATLKNELLKLESQIKQLETVTTGDSAPHEVPRELTTSEIRTRLDIRFAERVQDQLGGIIARRVGASMARSGEEKGGLLGEVDVVDVGEVNVHVHTGGESTTSRGATVIPCGSKQETGYQDSAEEARNFWFNLEQAEIQGQKDAIKAKAEESAKNKAREKAKQEARSAVCSGGSCAAGTKCASFPAALIHEPVIVASDATYSDSEGWSGSVGSSVKGTATAQCSVTYFCPCM